METLEELAVNELLDTDFTSAVELGCSGELLRVAESVVIEGVSNAEVSVDMVVKLCSDVSEERLVPR